MTTLWYWVRKSERMDALCEKKEYLESVISFLRSNSVKVVSLLEFKRLKGELADVEARIQKQMSEK